MHKPKRHIYGLKETQLFPEEKTSMSQCLSSHTGTVTAGTDTHLNWVFANNSSLNQSDLN